MRTAWLVALMLCAGCAAARPGLEDLSGIQIRHELVLALTDIQTEFTNETVLCLLGERHGNVLRIHGFAPARIDSRTPNSVRFLGCDDTDAVAWFHNHPHQDWDACRASLDDVTVLEMHPQRFAALVLSCDRGLVFRFRGQREEHFLPLLTGRTQEPSP